MSKLNIPTKGANDEVLYTEFNDLVNFVNALYTDKGASGVLEFPEMDIVHVNGTADNYAGISSIVSSAVGAGGDGSGHMTLTPASSYWKSLNIPANAMKMQVFTNVLAADMAGSGFANEISVSLMTAFMTGANAVTSGTRLSATFDANGSVTLAGGASPAGVLNSPPLISDAGTLYAVSSDAVGFPIGTGGDYSRYYFTFKINIPATAASKTYRFKIVLNYQ